VKKRLFTASAIILDTGSRKAAVHMLGIVVVFAFTVLISCELPNGTVAVSAVSLAPTSASIAINETQQLTATVTPSNATNKAVSWSTSAASVATVSSSGLVTGISVGTAKITVTTSDGNMTATCAVTVTSSGSGSGSIVLWYGKGNIYEAVSGDNNDIKKYDSIDFDHNPGPTNAFLIDSTTGEFWYESNTSPAAWYRVVAGVGNDEQLFSASDIDTSTMTQWLVLNKQLCYVTNDGSGHPTVYQVKAGAADSVLYGPADFDNNAALNGGMQLYSAGGNLYYVFWPDNGYIYKMIKGGIDQQVYTIYPPESSDVDIGASASTYYGNLRAVSGELWHNESYTGVDLWRIVKGTLNDIQVFTQTADFDGQIVDHWESGSPVLKKANAAPLTAVALFGEVK